MDQRSRIPTGPAAPQADRPTEEVDVLIVGAGPAGTSTALHLVQTNPRWAGRILVIDKAVHPRDKLCGGGVTHLAENIVDDLGLVMAPPNFAVRDVQLVYRDKRFSLRGDPVFRIVRRDEFDHWLLQAAEQRGVAVRQGETVTSVVVCSDYVEAITTRALIRAQILVAADGSRSTVRRSLSWHDGPHSARLLEVLTPADEQQPAEFRTGTAVFDFSRITDSLQGYNWIFPSYVSGEPVMNRGVFDSRVRRDLPRASLKDELRHALADRGLDLAEYALASHPVRSFDPHGRLATHRVLLAGDAAGVDPLFGEGISFALAYGRVAAAAVTDAFARGDFGFSTYRRRVLTDPLLKHLLLRTWVARLVYLGVHPWFVELAWKLAGLAFHVTPWHNARHRWTKRPLSWRQPGAGRHPASTP